MLDLLPTEVLQLVTDHLNGLYIGLLWLCGNKRLNKHMGDERGVIHFEIHSKFCAWPSLVRNFHHLESFRFIPFPSSRNLPNWTPEARNFLDLSPTLQSLDLSGLGDAIAFMDFLEEYDLSHLTSLTGGFTPNNLFDDAFEALPSLERLSGWIKEVLSPVSLPSHLKELALTVHELDLSTGIHFPDGLESLTLSFASEEVDSSWIWFSGLPVGLTELSIPFINLIDREDFKAKDIELLPLSLKSLTLDLGMSTVTVDFLRALPRNLTILRLRSEELPVDYWKEDDYAALKALPRTLRWITRYDEAASMVDCEPTKENAKFFPPGIFFDNPWVLWNQPIDKEVLLTSEPLYKEDRAMKLPDSVTAVEAEDSDYINMHMLPTSLTHLTVTISEVWTPIERFEHLPKSLHSLSISSDGPHVDFPFDLLPTHVQVLTLSNYSSKWKTTIEDCGALPRNLRSLTLFHVGLENPTTTWSLMPPRLEELSITGDTLPLGCAEALPKMSLQKLSLAFFVDPSCQLSHQILLRLPRSLTTLTLIDYSPGIENITYRSIINLPPGLVRFEVGWPLRPSASFTHNMEVLRLIFKRGPTWFGLFHRPRFAPFLGLNAW